MWMQAKKTVMRKALSAMSLDKKIFSFITHYASRMTSYVLFVSLFTVHCSLFTSPVFAEELKLQELIDEALKNNHEILMAESKWKTSSFRIPQVKSLPDPMFMFGYQNEGTRDLYTFGNEMMPDSQWMFSASQMFPFPGKLSLKGEMAAKDSQSLRASYEATKLKVISKVKELYYDLFLTHREINLIKDKTVL